MRFLVWVVVHALALALATWLFQGIHVGGATRTDQALTLVGVALVFGVVNAIVSPVVKLLSLPFILLTLGLFLFVVNALMLLLTSSISQAIGLHWRVHGFWTAVFGAIVITVASWVLEGLLGDHGD